MPSNKAIGYVICEAMETNSDARIIKENGRRVIAEGRLQTAEEVNRNGRTYLVGDLAREISCPRTIELINSGTMRGESGHPLDSSIVRQQTIQPDNCNVKFLKMWMEGNDVMAQFRGTNTSLGEAFDLDLRDGDKPAFSLRALGILVSESGRNIVKNLKMVTYDNVIYPSHPGAYTTRLITESCNIAKNKGQDTTPITEQSINKNGAIIPVTNDQVMSYIKSESANISSVLKQIDIFYESAALIENGTKVQMIAKTGDIFVVNLESYVTNEVYDFCSHIKGY